MHLSVDVHPDTDEVKKQYLADMMHDVEYEDVEDLPVEDVRGMVRRRHEREMQAYRESMAAVAAIRKGLDQLPEEKREQAEEGLQRFLVTENTDHLSGEDR